MFSSSNEDLELFFSVSVLGQIAALRQHMADVHKKRSGHYLMFTAH